MTPLLEVDGLRVAYPGPGRAMHPVDGVALTLQAGQMLALVGESGCGKSLTCLAILGLVPPPGQVVAGSRIIFAGSNLASLDPRSLQALRGRHIGMVFQDPTTSLNPVFTIGWQLEEAIATHHPAPRAAVRARARELLAEVGIPDPDERARAHPHELSGGQRQRVMIALALAGEPDLLLADEPTSALDVTVQAQILELLDRLRASRGMAVLLVTHDLALVAGRADHVAVMYAGQVVETAPAGELFRRPMHPYTRGLIRSVPRLEGPVARLEPIGGAVPAAAAWPAGCRFHPRCPEVLARCHTHSVAPVAIGPAHHASCWLHVPTAGAR